MISWQVFLRNHQVDLMKFGVAIDFEAIDRVTYQDAYLYAGQSLATWETNTLFWKTSKQNVLPQLKQGKTYCLKIYTSTQPIQRLYVKVTFFDRYQEKMMDKTFKKDENIFVMPEDAFYYSIELINGGLTSMIFERLEVSEVLDDNAIDKRGELEIKMLTGHGESKSCQVIFTEPDMLSVAPVDIVSVPNEQKLIQLTNRQALSHFYLDDGRCNEDILEILREQVTDENIKKVQLIGYGPISNFASSYYADILASDKIEVYHTPNQPLKLSDDYQKVIGFDIFNQFTTKFSNIKYYGHVDSSQPLFHITLPNQLANCPALNQYQL